MQCTGLLGIVKLNCTKIEINSNAFCLSYFECQARDWALQRIENCQQMLMGATFLAKNIEFKHFAIYFSFYSQDQF